MKKTIFISGGAGYVGSKLVEFSLKKNLKVVCYDNLVYGKDSIQKFLANKNFTFIKGDIRDKKKLKKVFQLHKIDFVVNLASIVGDKQCQTIPKTAYEVNFLGNKYLTEISKSKKVKKFVFASTCSNYGIVNPNEYADEKSELFPVSLYAESKIDCEKYLISQSNKNFSVTILRFATAYGVSNRTRFDLTINSFTYEALKYKKLHIFAKETWRPFIHVDDMCLMILRVLDIKGSKLNGLVLNAGFTSNNFSKQAIIEKIKNNVKNLKIEYVDAIIDRRDYRVNCDKIYKFLKIKQNKSINQGIKEIILNIKNKSIKERDIKNNLLDNNCKKLQQFYKY